MTAVNDKIFMLLKSPKFIGYPSLKEGVQQIFVAKVGGSV